MRILEDFLGVKKTTFSFAERWAAKPPLEAQGKSLAEYTVKVRLHITRSIPIWRLSRFSQGITLSTTMVTRSTTTSAEIT